MTIGIYAIVNNELNKVYIGKSKHIEKRWYEHSAHLRTNSHHNKELQKDWFRYGEDKFSFHIVQECSPVEIDILETELIARYREKNLYNYNFKQHPWAKVNAGKSSSLRYVKDQDGDLLPVKHCPGCDLDKLQNSFFNSIYCYECMTNIEAELLEEIETIESISILTGISSAPEGKPVSKYKLSSD